MTAFSSAISVCASSEPWQAPTLPKRRKNKGNIRQARNVLLRSVQAAKSCFEPQRDKNNINTRAHSSPCTTLRCTFDRNKLTHAHNPSRTQPKTETGDTVRQTVARTRRCASTHTNLPPDSRRAEQNESADCFHGSNFCGTRMVPLFCSMTSVQLASLSRQAGEIVGILTGTL